MNGDWMFAEMNIHCNNTCRGVLNNFVIPQLGLQSEVIQATHERDFNTVYEIY